MDELKLRLSSKFMKNIITKIVAKKIFKKLGYKIDIELNNIDIETVDGKVCLHVDLNAEVEKEEFVKILKDVDLI